MLTLIVTELERIRRRENLANFKRLQVVALGSLLAFGLPVVLTLAEYLTGGRSPQNALALTGVIFPLAVAYAFVWVEADAPVTAGA